MEQKESIVGRTRWDDRLEELCLIDEMLYSGKGVLLKMFKWIRNFNPCPLRSACYEKDVNVIY